MTSSISIGTSGCMCSRVRFESRSLLMLDLRAVLIRLSPLKDLSAEHEVTGSVQRIVARTLMLGKKLEIRGNVDERVEGSEAKP